MRKASITVGIVYGVAFMGGIETLTVVYKINRVNFNSVNINGMNFFRQDNGGVVRRCRRRQITFVFYRRHGWLSVGVRFCSCPLLCELTPAFTCIICSSFFGIWRALAVSCRRPDTIFYRFFRKNPDIPFSRVTMRTLYFQKCLQIGC